MEELNKTNHPPTQSKAKPVYQVCFPSPHGRVHASSKLMIAWGYNDWAAEAISTKYGIKLEKIGTNRTYNTTWYKVTMPEHFDQQCLIDKLQKLYKISWHTYNDY